MLFFGILPAGYLSCALIASADERGRITFIGGLFRAIPFRWIKSTSGDCASKTKVPSGRTLNALPVFSILQILSEAAIYLQSSSNEVF